MVSRCAFVLSALLALALAGCASATTGVIFSTLSGAFVVNAQVNGVEVNDASNSVMVYLQDTLTVTWRLNETFVGQDGAYQKVITRLCYGKPSTTGRGWRAPNADLSRDRQCYTTIDGTPYPPSTNMTVNGLSVFFHTLSWVPPSSTPGAQYFIRVFALNSSTSDASPAWNAVATGQNSNVNTTSNLVTVTPYTGVTSSLIITIVVLSVGSYVLLFGIFFAERWMKKNK